MIFWIITLGLSAFVAVLCLRSLFFTSDDRPDNQRFDIAIYRDQLTGVDLDAQRGLLNDADAEQARTEIARRILALDAQNDTAPKLSPRPAKTLAIALGLLLMGGSFWLYSGGFGFQGLGAHGYPDMGLETRKQMAKETQANRPSQIQAEAALRQTPPAPTDETAEFQTLMQKLRAIVKERPDDLQGHILLAQNEYRLQNFSAAREAMAGVLRIKGDATTQDDLIKYLDLMVIAAGGFVSPEAEAIARRILATDPQNAVAHYYMGMMFSQTGRPDMGFRIWDRLLRAGPQDAPWIAPILAEIPQLAVRAGVDYDIDQIRSQIGETAPDALSSEALTAAQDMNPQARDEMVGAMVARLSDRLATQGGPAQDWARLIRALHVLGRGQEAEAITQNARTVFQNDPDALNLLEKAAKAAP